jgi:hypothetical protein
MKKFLLAPIGVLVIGLTSYGQVNQQPYFEEGTWQNEQYQQYGLPNFELQNLSFMVGGVTYNPSGTKFWYHEDSSAWDEAYPNNPGYFGIKAINPDGSTDEIYLDSGSSSLRYWGTSADGKFVEVNFTMTDTNASGISTLDNLVYAGATTWDSENGYQNLESRPEGIPNTFSLGDYLLSQSNVDWINATVGFSQFNSPPQFSQGSSETFVEQAQELNVGLTFEDGQWTPVP